MSQRIRSEVIFSAMISNCFASGSLFVVLNKNIVLAPVNEINTGCIVKTIIKMRSERAADAKQLSLFYFFQR